MTKINSFRFLTGFSMFLILSFAVSENIQAQDRTAGITVKQNRFQRLLKKKNIVLLDVRTVEEFKEGHIPDATLIDVQKIPEFKKYVSGLDKNKTYLIYCRSGKRSNTAKVFMQEIGFKKLVDLEGGFSQWTGQKKSD